MVIAAQGQTWFSSKRYYHQHVAEVDRFMHILMFVVILSTIFSCCSPFIAVVVTAMASVLPQSASG